MAKTVESKSKKEKAPSQKDNLYNIAGIALAEALPDNDVMRVKPVGTSEGVLVRIEDKDFYLIITEKKKPIEFEDEDVKTDYTAAIREGEPVEAE